MKTAILAAVAMVFAYLLARRAAPVVPGIDPLEGVVPGPWQLWPVAEPSPWDANQAGEWVTIGMPPQAGGYVGSDQVDTMPDQLAGTLAAAVAGAGAALAALPETVGIAQPTPPELAARNVAAFLDMIAYAEGTAGPDGYRTMFGYRLFDSFADHPRQFFEFTNSRGETLRTSAAGRYQFLARTWDTLKKRLKLPDFGPESQDRAAIELIRERGALSDVRAGRVAAAVVKVAPVWASLPGAGYAQPERNLSALIATYTQAGGNLET